MPGQKEIHLQTMNKSKSLCSQSTSIPQLQIINNTAKIFSSHKGFEESKHRLKFSKNYYFRKECDLNMDHVFPEIRKITKESVLIRSIR